MSDSPENAPYDWNAHFGIQADLRALDDFHLQMTGKRPLLRGSIEKHLHQEFNRVVNRNYVDMKEYFRLLARPVNNLIALADRHAVMCATRADAIVGYLQDLTEIFPEERWKPFLSYEIHSKGKLLEDIHDSLEAVKPVYMTGGRQYYTHASWTGARRSLEITRAHFKEIESRSPIPDGAPLEENVLQQRSLALAERQDFIAKGTLEHAYMQMVLARDSLRLATTLSVLPLRYKAAFEDTIFSCADVANNLMIAADFTLDEAADLRNSSHQSRDLLRPVF